MCDHLQRLARGRAAPVHPGSLGCRECLESGGEWVHLRLCLTCGHVGCCDDSPGRHATHHARTTRHPVIKSFEPGEDWAWCYVDQEMAETISVFPEESPARHYAPPEARP